MPHHRYVRAADLTAEFGFTDRHWIKQAAAGRVPGAFQPFGPHSTWVFDIETVRAWWAEVGIRPEPTPTPRLYKQASHRLTAKPPIRRDLSKQLAALRQAGRKPPSPK